MPSHIGDGDRWDVLTAADNAPRNTQARYRAPLINSVPYYGVGRATCRGSRRLIQKQAGDQQQVGTQSGASSDRQLVEWRMVIGPVTRARREA